MGEHLRLMHQVRRPRVTSQLRTSSGQGGRAKELLQAMQMSRDSQSSATSSETLSCIERHKVELEELAKKQEQCVVRVVEQNKEEEERSLKKHKVMEEVVKRIDLEKQEKLKKDCEERNRKERGKQKIERKERKQQLQIEFDKQVQELKVALETKFMKENADAEEYFQWEEKVWEDAEKEALKEEKDEAERELERRREELNEEKNLRARSLSLLVKDNEAKWKSLLLKQKEELEEIHSARKRRRRRGSEDELEELASKKQPPPCPPECPVCFNEMAPPVKIFQCSNGHHICETCKDQLEPSICPKCRKRLIGRATDMENFLLLFCRPAPAQKSVD